MHQISDKDILVGIAASGSTPYVLGAIESAKKNGSNLNPRLEIAGLLRTMFDPRNTLANHVSQQLEQHFGDKVYRTLVPRNVRLAEAPSYGAPAVVWDKTSKGAQAYVALTEEILRGYP